MPIVQQAGSYRLNSPARKCDGVGHAGNGSLPDTWSIPSFVINLERNVERREHMQAAFDRLGIAAEFTPAVDGKRLADPLWNVSQLLLTGLLLD